MVSEEICPPVRVGVLAKVRVNFRVGGRRGNQTTALEENCPLVSVMVWVRVSFGVGGRKTLFAFDYTCLI